MSVLLEVTANSSNELYITAWRGRKVLLTIKLTQPCLIDDIFYVTLESLTPNLRRGELAALKKRLLDFTAQRLVAQVANNAPESHHKFLRFFGFAPSAKAVGALEYKKEVS